MGPLLPIHELPAALYAQLESISVDGTSENNVITSQKTYNIDGRRCSSAKVDVKFEFAKWEQKIPEGVAFCGGGRSFSYKADVTVTPADSKTIDVVKAHLKSQVLPGLFSSPEMKLFDSIVINNEKIS
jgi:hypothetical protein